jgi:FkbM family methyltransferase
MNIPGEMHQDTWQNFAHNRTLALQKAFGKTDLLLVFDADDEIVGFPELPGVNATIYDEYHLKFGSPLGTAYTRILLVNNMKRFVYQSVIHEYIVCVEPANVPRTGAVIEGDYYVVSGRSGNRSLDPEKYLKDAKILEGAHAEAVLKNDPLFKRYAFYCANSYKDYGSLEDAIKWYKITLGQENWAQEHYMSCFHIYECYLKLQNLEQGFFYLVKAFKYDQERVECLYPLLVHYCCEGQYRMAYNYYLQVKDFYETKYLSTNVDGKLFVSIDKYNFFVPYYMILIADKMKDYDCVIKMFEIVFTKKMPVADDDYVGNILFNLQFFVQRVKSENMTRFINLATEYIRFLSEMGLQLQRHEFLREYEMRFGIDVSYIFSNVVLKNKMNFSKEECKNSKNILIYTGYANVEWNYSYLKNNALGGSEKAVAYLSKELASLLASGEYNVYVAGVVQSESFDNVTYVKLQDIPNLIKSIPFNTVICSRYISFLEIYQECAFDKFYIWAHDIVLLNYGCNLNDKQIITKWDKYITGCICQTEWHANLFKDFYPELTNKITAINNGLDKNTFLNGSQTMSLNNCKKQSNKFIYSSRPERGLDTLLQLWPQILEVLPDAELVLATYGSPPDQPIIDVINKYSSSIKYLGKLNTEDLYKEMKTAEYWLYPTKFTETSCITGMEMLMSEVICLYYPVAGLINTMDKYGIQIAPGNEIETLLNLTVKQKHDLKINGKKYALTCSWENRAKEWANVIFSGEQEEEEIQTFIRNLHNTVSMPQNHTNYLKKLAIDFEPKVIYDIGSSVLHWTREAHKIWPNSEIIAFDAFQGVEFFYKEHNIKYHIGVLSKEDNYPVKFYENSLHSAGNSYYKEIGHSRSDEIYPENVFTEKIAMKLNTVVKNNHFLLPDLIKMDVQGAELDIIKGGLDIINNAKYLIVELQDTEYNRGAPLAATTIKFLEENGWELIAPKFCDNGPDADYCFKNKRYGINIKNIAIFNSFSFHYEMFGYIIEYCQKYNHKLTIFTNFEKDLGWLDFYKNHFKTYHFEITDIFKYKELQEIFDITFITTDDDYKFKSEWINDKCIVVDHTSIIRRPKYKHRIGTRSFINNYRDWAIPCYKVFEKKDKTNLLESDIHIAIIGGNNSNNNIYNYDLINKIYSEKHIHLHVISRNALSFDKNFVKELINITIYDKIETTYLFDILKKCDYMLTDFTFNNDYINGTSISGNIPLAFSTLTPLIISKQNNALYKFKNVVEFDIDMETSEKIYINKNIVNLDELSNEREFLISMFASYIDENVILKQHQNKIPKKIYQTWETKDLDPEFQAIVDKWKINNPEYEYQLFDKYEREDFIKNFFNNDVFDAYNMIIPGANKTDLWRYCYLYIHGGVYVDIDSLCIGHLDDYILNNMEFVVPIDLNVNLSEGNHNLACGFIASVQNHPILLDCIKRIVYNVKNNILVLSALDFTGPGLLGRSVNVYLGENEINSFVGKEGIVLCKNKNKIHFLKFDLNTEYVKDLQNNILFQNKNGNPDIIRLYNNECYKIKSYVNWATCPTNMRINIEEKNIVLMIYGQFRTYKNNLRKNLNMMKPIFKNHNVYVFILSDKNKSGNYSIENENEIKYIFKEFNFNIYLFDYVENYDNSEEQEVKTQFLTNARHAKGIDNDFVPNLLYRKYLLNKLKNTYIQNNKLNIDLTVYCRLFDIKITNNLSFEEIEINSLYNNTNILFGSSDTFFIGSSDTIDYLFNLSTLYKNGILYHDTIWEDNNLVNFINGIDLCLCNCKATYSPEIQYIAHMYYSEYKYKNIRVDFNNINSVLNKDALYHVKLDPSRNNFTVETQYIFTLTSENINSITNNISSDYKKYFSNQGVIDYNMGIGKEHYKLLTCISQSIKNGIIIDIGSHNGNSAVALGYSLFLNNENDIYSFDIKNMLEPECEKFFDKYAIQYRLENIFDRNIREKYKFLLLSSSVILIDIDPHNGILEYEMYNWLNVNNYQGIIIYDDIFLKVDHIANGYEPTTHNMIDFWNKIPNEHKLDLTNIGHWSGTGIVCFNFNKNNFILDK